MRNSIVFLIIIFSFFGCSENNDSNSTKLKGGFIKNGDTNIYYSEKGTGDTTLLFLHGWGINNSYWKDQIDYFSGSYKTVAIDLPGFGKSTTDRRNYTVEKYAEDVNNFINQKNLENVILIGHSMSGDIILETALKNNKAIIGLVGVDNFKFVGIPINDGQQNEIDSFIDSLKKDYKKIAPEYAAKFLFSSSTDSLIRKRVMNDYGNSNPEAGTSSISNIFNYEEADKLQNLNYKLFLINSDGSPTNKEGLKKYCSKSYEIFEIHNSGHFPMIEKPGEFNQQLQKIINKMNMD